MRLRIELASWQPRPDSVAVWPVVRWSNPLERMLGLAAIVFTSVAAYMAIHFARSFSGDALIHISIMERSARGDWFAFGPASRDSSSSSVLWTVLGSMLWRAGGVRLALLGLKVVGFASWVGVGVLAYSLGRQQGVSRLVAIVGGLASIAL